MIWEPGFEVQVLFSFQVNAILPALEMLGVDVRLRFHPQASPAVQSRLPLQIFPEMTLLHGFLMTALRSLAALSSLVLLFQQLAYEPGPSKTKPHRGHWIVLRGLRSSPKFGLPSLRAKDLKQVVVPPLQPERLELPGPLLISAREMTACPHSEPLASAAPRTDSSSPSLTLEAEVCQLAQVMQVPSRVEPRSDSSLLEPKAFQQEPEQPYFPAELKTD
jgi:hypothetical protein